MSQDQVLLQNELALVSTTRVVVGGTTYATANLTSVSKKVEQPKRGCAMMLLAFGFLFALGGANSEDGGTLLILGVIGALIGFFWFRSLKPIYHLFFWTAGGEQQVLASYSEESIDQIVGSVNDAIISRG